MIIFLYGPDDYRRFQRGKFYIEEFKKKYSGLSVGYFDLALGAGGESGVSGADVLENLKNFLRSQSIFDDKKFAVVKNLGELGEKEQKEFKEHLLSVVAKKTTIVLCSEKTKPPAALKSLLEKPAIAENFEYLTGYEWNKFIVAEAKRLGLAMDNSAANLLAGVYSGNTWGLVTELQKIANLGKKSVTAADLEKLDLEIAPNYWVLINGLKSQNSANRLIALEKMFAIGEPPPKIFNILASQWKEKIPQTAEYDLKVKSGKLDYEEALVGLLFS